MKIVRKFGVSCMCAVALSAADAHGAIVIAGWNAFNSNTGLFPRAADSLGANISSATISSPTSIATYGDATQFVLGTTAAGATQWNTGASVNTAQYLQFSTSIQSGYQATFSSFEFNGYKDDTALTLHLRSSADSFAADLGTIPLSGLSSALYSVNLSSMAAQTGTVTFRIYGTDANTASVFLWGANGATSSGGFLTVNGTVSAVPEPEQYAFVFGAGLLGLALWRRHSARRA
jgi:hypothetical protein